jgi:EmrB/QacA subfamily drug resistance transporter
MAAVMVSLLLSALDSTIVATAMPKILQELHGLHLYAWAMTAYLLASTIAIPIHGKLSDLLGRKAVLVYSVLLFLAGSLLSGMAGSMESLIAFRALQGLGCAGISAISFTIAADLFPAAVRGKYQGIVSLVFGVGAIAGPLLGGFLTDALSWRWVFFVNMPIGLVALALIATQMPALKPELKGKVYIDWKGALAFLSASVPLLLALSLGGNTYSWGSWRILGLFGIGAVGLLAFFFIERNAKEPILSMRVLRNPTFISGSLAIALIGGAGFFAAGYFLPVFVVMVLGASASGAGMAVLPLMVAWALSAFISGFLVTKTGNYKGILLVSSLMVFVGYLLLQDISIDTTRTGITWRMILLGIGLGPAIPIFTLAIQNAAHPGEMGAVTGNTQFLRTLGSTIGVALLGTVLSTTLAARLADYLPAGLAGEGAGSMVIDASQLRSGNLTGIDNRIRAAMLAKYAKVEVALTGADPTALQALLADPALPASLKAVLAPLPTDTERGTRSLGDRLAAAKAILETEAEAATSAVTRALKLAFTDAIKRVYVWVLFIIAAGFIATLFLPELALRKTTGLQAESEGDSPGLESREA